ncbi:T9SS type A sorting domain-containing protein [Algoriphagus sp. Y33]|uniref:T9SS type A sorting domain-containing protein n=1 Tax=Algoriphagus sp. Y33 TaxID=2772483 RepID=UPI0017811483|nr:T9SS type A sorting domain-containing protein [Algoriphagus sp. Y33]
MKRRVLFSVGLLICMVFTSLKPTEINPFRIYPYLQVYGNNKIQLTWFSNSLAESSIKLVGEEGSVIFRGKVDAEAVPDIYYTSQEKSQNINGLEQGSWLKTDHIFRYRFYVDLPQDQDVNYTVTLSDSDYSGSFTTPKSKSNWDKIRFIALADSETDPKGRVTNRAWYPGQPLFRPFSNPTLWKEKFGTTTEQGIEFLNYFLTEEKGYNENLKIIDSRSPDFILMPGDLVQGGGYQPAWDEFFRHNAGQIGNGLSRYAIIPALGNWEAYGGINGGYGTNEKGEFIPLVGRKRFHTYFETPTEDPLQKHRQSYYRVDYGPVTILTLDSSNGTPDQTAADFEGQPKLTGKQFTVPGTDTQENYNQAQYNAAGGNDLSGFGPGSDQYIWLEENLKEASENGQLIFVQYHHIAYSSGEHGVPMNHELSVGQVGTPMQVLNPMLEKYGVIAVLSGHDELFERSFVDEDGDGKGIMYYDVGVAGDGMRGEKRDWFGNPFNTLNYNQYRKWTADQSEPEQWDMSGTNPVLTDGGKHYGHLEVNLEKSVEGNQEFALIKFTPVYAFPVMDQNYNLQKIERRVYKDEVSMKIPLRKTEFVPVVNDSVTIYLDHEGKAYLTSLDFLKDQPEEAASFTFTSSQGFEFDCRDLGENEITITSTNSASGDIWEDGVRLFVLDTIKPYFRSISKTFEFDPVIGKVEFSKDDFTDIDIQDNCSGDYDVTFGRSKTITCADLQEYYEKGRLDVDITVSDQSNNKSTIRSFITLDVIESVKVSLTVTSESQNGNPVKLMLGSEFPFEVLGWYSGEGLISSSSDKELMVSKTGVYKAKLRTLNGCEVFSKPVEVTFDGAPEWPVVKDKIELELVKEGKATLKPEHVFTKWPINSEFTVELSKSEFSCDVLWSNAVVVKITDSKGTVAEEEIEVIVRDKSNPVLVTKNVEVVVDLSTGKEALNSEDFIASLTDNCGIKEVKLSRQSVGCDDIGKEITVEVGAFDIAGNAVQKLAKVTVKSTNSEPVTISGSAFLCIGNSKTLTLESEAVFEVVRWHKNGTVISGTTDKTLAVEEGGSYHAIVRYAGGCLFETEKFEVETIAKPNGEIEEDGNILSAPDGDFTYKWFKNDVEIGGETSRTMEVHAMGEYAVELTNEAGCTARLTSVTMTISGILQPGSILSEKLKIYPNPASGQVEIQTLGDLEFAENSMRIYDQNGKDVSSIVEVISHSPNAVKLAISRLAAGTYVIMVESQENRMFVGKLMKK